MQNAFNPNALSRHINGNKISIMQGDITTIPADAAVIPHLPYMLPDGGVGMAFVRKGAGAAMSEFGRYMEENKKSPWGGAHPPALPHGTLYVTESGTPNAKYLMHAVTVQIGWQGAAFEVIRDTFLSALQAADALGLRSVSVPALGAGATKGLSAENSALALMHAVDAFKPLNGPVDTQFVLFDSAMTDTFSKALRHETYRTATPPQRLSPLGQKWAHQSGMPETVFPINHTTAYAPAVQARLVAGNASPNIPKPTP